MSSVYFDLLIETERTAKLMSRVVKNYIMDTHSPCNVAQIMILHILMEMGGARSPHEIASNMEYLYTNSTYNFQSLLRHGYIEQINGEFVGVDKRCVFFEVSVEGKKLYENVCSFVDDKMKRIKERLHWSEENFTDYFDDLTALQSIMGKH